MTSLPVTFASASSPPTSVSFKDALASYHRSQYLLANSKVVPSASGLSNTHAGSGDKNDPELGERPRMDANRHGSIDELDLDDTYFGYSTAHTVRVQVSESRTVETTSGPLGSNHEQSPLLHKSISFSSYTPLSRQSSGVCRGASSMALPSDQPLHLKDALSPGERNLDGGDPVGPCKDATGKQNHSGSSSYGQTLFNSIAILVGVGMLSEPLAFAYAGWIGGTVLIIIYGSLSCYTAKILARIILEDPHLHSYSDIGLKAFGPKSVFFTGGLFCLELFAVSVLLVTLFADSMHTVYPAYSADTYKIAGLIVLIPTAFLPLSLLSYASFLGIISTISIITVILIDGFSKREGPGSLWQPADTSFGISSAGKLGVSFGLFMAGFSGHAVIPSLARDMIDPTEFDHMINWAFVIATFTYTSIGYAGYLMFGNAVNEEISVDLLQTPGYPAILNQAVLWMLVISPLTKFALSTRPINIIIENYLGLDPRSTPKLADQKMPSEDDRRLRPRSAIAGIFIMLERALLPVSSVCVSIVLPDFSSTMAFLGSFAAFTICVIGPVATHVALTGRCTAFDASILVVIGVMAIWGTAAAFLEA